MGSTQSSHAGSPPYKSCPIDRQFNEGRLATVTPGLWDDPISCALRVVSLDVPLPEILSYAWGNPKVTKTISVNGHQSNITVKLHAALQRLRYPDKAREIWIDAICIDQSNSNERTHQVSRMSRIYSQALEVVVLLGPDDNFAELGFTTLTAMAEDKTLHYNTDLESHFRPPIFENSHWEASLKLLTRPWWYRTWTVQEAILPSKLTFVCGQHSIPGNTLLRAASQYREHFNSSCCSQYLFMSATQETRSVMKSLYDLVQASQREKQQKEQESTSVDFDELLFIFSDRISYDMRDKVYGLLALATGKFRDLVVADYQAKVEDVYTKASFELLSRSTDLSSLNLRATGRKLSTLNLPSWVTDWSTASTS